MLKVKVVEDLI